MVSEFVFGYFEIYLSLPGTKNVEFYKELTETSNYILHVFFKNIIF